MCLHLCLLWEHICGAYIALEFLFCLWVLAWILMPLSHKRCYAILKDITELLELDSSIRLIEARGQQLSLNRSISRNFFTFLSPSARCRSFRVELEWVPGPARRPGSEEKLAENKPSLRYYPDSNLRKTRELFVRLDRAQMNVGYTMLEYRSKILRAR